MLARSTRKAITKVVHSSSRPVATCRSTADFWTELLGKIAAPQHIKPDVTVLPQASTQVRNAGQCSAPLHAACAAMQKVTH